MDDEADRNPSEDIHAQQEKQTQSGLRISIPAEIGEGKDIYIVERPHSKWLAVWTGIVASIIASALLWVFSGMTVPGVCTQIGSLLVGLP